jgi:DNA helicase-2/ATP-dependent DNA helicase PcrA
MNLNDIQKQAVCNISSPVIVNAGPGTGKTFLIIEKIKYLITKGFTENSILAVTFSKKAAEEIKNRLSDTLGLFSEVNIETFHSLAEKILRENYKFFDLKKDFIVMDRMESFVFLSDHIFDFDINILRPLSNPDKEIDKILEFFSKLEDEYISPEEFINLKNKDEYFEELSYLYEKYLQLKIEESKLEFNDLIYLVLKIFEKNPNILKKYKERYKYILVDEFQDTNYIQNQLILKLASNITVVGDKNQSIYKFRGAALSNFNTFKKFFADSIEYTLDYNYRSYQEIIDEAYSFIGDSNTLKSVKGSNKDDIRILNFNKNTQEVNYIKDEIIKMHNNGIKFSDIAILLRSNSYINDFAELFIKYNIPIYLRGSSTFEMSQEFKDLSSVVYFSENSSDNISFLRILSIESFNISKEEFAGIIDFLNTNFKGKSYFEGLSKIVESKSDEYSFKTNKIINVYNILSRLLDKDIAILDKINEFLDSSFYFDFLHKKNDSIVKRSNLDRFIAIIEKLQENNVEYFSKYIKNIDKISSIDDDISEDVNFDSVTISTIHSVKGLEFEYVFIPYLVKDRFPTRNRGGDIGINSSLLHESVPEEESFIEEEKRLFFVALTRAKKSVYLSYSDMYEGNKTKKDKSIFLTGFHKKTERINLDNKSEKSTYIDPDFFIPENSIPQKYSYSQLNLFKTCPLQYYYEYILRVKKQPKLVFEYGNLIHDTLKQYLQRDRNILNIDLLDNIYNARWERVNLSVFRSKEHIDSYKKKGLESIKNNIELIKPRGLSNSYEENIDLFMDQIYPINGRLDRLDFLEDGTVSIIDYKTGSSSSQDTSSSNMQLGIYSILVKEKFKKEIKDLKLIFIDEGKEITINYDKIDIDRVKNEVIDLIVKIRELEVKATPSFACTYCEYRSLCYKR